MKQYTISTRRIHNAYLLLGQEEEELERMAGQFAATVLSEEEHFQEKGFVSAKEYKENVAARVQKGEHPDCIIVNFEEKQGGGKKGSISIEQIRRDVKATVEISPKEGKYKVYLIWHSDSMTIEAQNAILKTLEEAPEHVIILLLAKNATRLLPTVLSRVVRVFVGEMDIEKRWETLMQNPILARLLPFLREIHRKSQVEMQKFVEELSTVDSEDLFCFLDIILRDVLCYKCSKDTKLLYGREAVVHIVEMGERYSFRALGRWGEYMERYKEGKLYNVQSSLQLMDLFFLLSEEV